MRITAFDGTVTEINVNEAAGVVHISNKLDVSDLLDANTVIRNEVGKARPRNKDEWHHVGRIDLMTYLALKQQGIIGDDDSVDQKRFRQWLNDRDNRGFRVSEGNV
jgi:hypothetical protein